MPDKLYLLKDDTSLFEMTEVSFPTEDAFQALLEKFPALLTDLGSGVETPRRWVLVKREAGIADRIDGGNRWSLDHLFLDQDGVPTLVELKRATDSRARREVVAQMLDYAANSVQWWRVGDLRAWFDESCLKAGKDPREVLSGLIQTEPVDSEAFWKAVESNLASGRIRMIIVADRLAPELERIVEFLNEQMRPATVLALELRPFSNGADKILSPRLIGDTARAAAQKSTSPRSVAGSIEDWFTELSIEPEHVAQLKKFRNLVEELGGRLVLAGQSIAVEMKTAIGPCNILYLRSYGKVALSGWMLRKIPGLEGEAERVKVFDDFEKAGFSLSNKFANGEPNIKLPRSDDADGWLLFERFLRSFFDKLKAA